MSSGLTDKVVGILGGGQLGRMACLEAIRLGITVNVLDPGGPSCASAPVAAKVVQGSFRDPEQVKAFAKSCDVVTVEIEHVAVDALKQLESEGVSVIPNSKSLEIIRDKSGQKAVLQEHDVPVIPFLNLETNTKEAVLEAAAQLGGFPLMVKARREAYDGRGNYVVKKPEDIAAAIEFLTGGRDNVALYVEQWASFKAEVSIIVVVSATGQVVVYDPVETRQENNLCRLVALPPTFEFSSAASRLAKEVAMKATLALDSPGIFAIEMFYMDDTTILVNEIAPRPHNSGHITIEACETSQFEQHLRAVCGLPLGSTAPRVPAAAMVNILGGETEAATTAKMAPALSTPGASVHWYGKTPNKLGRKLGHLTVTAPNATELEARLKMLGESLEDSVRGTAVVGVIMGSDSDLPPMKACADYLTQFNVPFELTVVSAHRTPERMFEYAKTAASRGIQVIIAAAGGAAHLPGMVAALTELPVIGVPIKTSTLNGQDSLLSIVQMPRGIPVATVAIGNSTNAAILAVRVLSLNDSNLRERLLDFHFSQTEQVLEKAAYLEDTKYEKYLKEGGVKNYRPYIEAGFNKVLEETYLKMPNMTKYKGKVRDCYFGEKLSVLIATDRLSGFDRNLGLIPFKGAVLNRISMWWFNKTSHIIDNHVITSPHSNVCLAKKCKPFAIEFVVRGYLTGSTSTSIWTAYSSGKREYCGHSLPDGMVKNQRLEKIICTPTTKSEIHDMPISGKEIVAQNIMSQEHWSYCEAKALELFKYGQEVALKQGMLLVDTKYEFGIDESGKVLLIDEIHTPDSSRYWIADSYEARMSAGQTPEHIDKEFVRLWYKQHCDPYKDEVLPSAPRSLLQELSNRYITLFERITGETFTFSFLPGDPNSQIQSVITEELSRLNAM